MERMMVMRNTLLFLMFCIGFVTLAQAEPIPMPPELKDYLMRPEHENAVVGMMVQQWKAFVPDCPTHKLENTNVLISKLPEFDASGEPISGEWRIISHMSGCSETRMLSVLYYFAADGTMKRIGLLPGTTIASPRLQVDSITYAVLAMHKLMPTPDCKDIVVANTEFAGFDKENASTNTTGDTHSSSEKWTMRTCGVTGVVTMHFVPNAKGMSIQTNLDETQRLN